MAIRLIRFWNKKSQTNYSISVIQKTAACVNHLTPINLSVSLFFSELFVSAKEYEMNTTRFTWTTFNILKHCLDEQRFPKTGPGTIKMVRKDS